MKTVLEADYSVALQLMLKYPPPSHPHGPHTFVDDAMYLKGHCDAAGGVTLIFKYTGKSPASTAMPTPASSRAATPAFPKFNTLRQRTLGARSPLSTSARILQQPGGVEALLQGAAKNMMERSEKLGINQAVRDAMGEIRRNVQGLQETRTATRGPRSLLSETSSSLSEASLTVALMEARNRRLAAMLDESVANLKLLAASGLQRAHESNVETVEIAAAKIQFVKACLEDPAMALPEEELPPLGGLTISSPPELASPTVALDIDPVLVTSSAVVETRTTLSPTGSVKGESTPASPPQEVQALQQVDSVDEMDTDHHENDTLPPLQSEITNSPPPPLPSISTVIPDPPPPPAQRAPRLNRGPIPMRSTLAQSSFAWMLEPDTTTSSLPRVSPSTTAPSGRPPSSGGSGSATQKKRNNPSRERNAFLFGEVTADGAGQGGLSADQIFGLQPIQRSG